MNPVPPISHISLLSYQLYDHRWAYYTHCPMPTNQSGGIMIHSKQSHTLQIYFPLVPIWFQLTISNFWCHLLIALPTLDIFYWYVLSSV